MNTQALWYCSRATGAVSLVLFSGVMLLGILTSARRGERVLPRAGWLRLHRTVSITAVVFLAVHIITAIADGYVPIGYWDTVIPFTASWNPLWVGLGAVAVDLLLAVLVSSALRRRLSPGLWRAVHLASYAMWPIAILHGFGTAGGDGKSTWMIAIDGLCIATVLGTLAVRLRPDRHPDTVARASAAIAHPRRSDGGDR